jgi:predicted HAD superfamily hydrolase
LRHAAPRALRRAGHAAQILPWRIARAASASKFAGFSRAALVTLDVFDTALLRSVALPVDVFWLTAHRLAARTGAAIDVEQFARDRIAAEDRARAAARRAGRHEVTLDEIYAELPACWTGRDALQAEERRTEADVCFANPDILALYTQLVAGGTAVAFISDTYFDAALVRGLLENAGYAGAFRVFVSSAHGLSKADGNLFPVVANEMGVEPARIWHIGDNPHADVRRARAAGWHALWYRPKLASRPRSTPATGGDRIVASLLEGIPDALAGAGAHPVWGPIGYRVGGPIYLGFAQFVAERVAGTPAALVSFCARDGKIIRAAYQRLQALAPDLPASIYLLVSRRSLVFPLITRIGETELHFLTGQFAALRVDEVFHRIGLDAGRYAGRIEQAGLAAEQRVTSERDVLSLRRLLQDIESDIVEAAARERELLAAYFREQGLFAAADLVFVDIGWQASLQKAAARLLTMNGHAPRLSGLYFGTSPNVRELDAACGRVEGWFVDAGQPASRYEVTRTQWAILELLFTATHGSVLSYARGARGIEAVLDQDGGAGELPAYERAAGEIQSAALAFIDRYIAAFGGCMPLPIAAGHVAGPLERLTLAPSIEEARALGDLFHVDGFGATRTGQHIARPPGWAWAKTPRRLMEGYRQASWRRGYLVRLFGSRWLAFRAIRLLSRLRPGFKSA